MLIVDDHDVDQTALVGKLVGRGLSAAALHPEEVDAQDLLGADLVLVDYRLEAWPERDAAPLAASTTDGHLTLGNRSATRSRSRRIGPWVLHSIRPSLASCRPCCRDPVTKHALARANNFEWVFDKTQESDVRGIESLANACRGLPEDWEESDAADRLLELVAMPSQGWRDSAVDQLLRCRPPLHELSRSTDGLAVLRWLLHRILPYPCFLYGVERLAVRLGVPIEELRNRLLPAGSDLARFLEPVEYVGVLAEFAGPRWWGPGIEALLWDATDGESFRPESVRSLIEAIAGLQLESRVRNIRFSQSMTSTSTSANPVEWRMPYASSRMTGPRTPTTPGQSGPTWSSRLA